MIARYDISYIEKVFAPEDRVERIYINFCNPWTKRPKYAKRRLTHPRQLMQYREFLVDGGEIWFKTDDTALFTESLPYFDACGFELRYQTERSARGGRDAQLHQRARNEVHRAGRAD